MSAHCSVSKIKFSKQLVTFQGAPQSVKCTWLSTFCKQLSYKITVMEIFTTQGQVKPHKESMRLKLGSGQTNKTLCTKCTFR